MRLSIYIVILLILVTTSLAPAVPSQTLEYAPSDMVDLVNIDEIERNWTIHFVFVNYDPDTILRDVFLSPLPTQNRFYTELTYISYHINYEVTFASPSYYEQIRTLAVNHCDIGPAVGTRLDENALGYQRAHPDEPQRVFYPRAGMSIDADVLEAWLLSNPAVTPPDLGYVFYVFNFSEFDSPDHSFEHWYDYHPIDPDTGQPQRWFRLEWDNELNPDVMLQYPGFGGKRGNLYVLDPSADQWYLRWAAIWWNDASPPAHTWNDLDEYCKTLDLQTQAGRTALSDYLSNYVYDPVAYLLTPTQHDPSAFVTRGLLRGLVFCMDVERGITVESLEWVTNAQIQRAHLQELLPFLSWSVQIDFIDIRTEPAWEDLFWDYAEIRDGVVWVDGYEQFYAIYSLMRPEYVNTADSNINVFGVVFIKQRMVMYTDSGTFTGLGGGGQTVIWKSWERYYMPDNVTPKSGVSTVQLHETMHAIGIMHTWVPNHYVADFSSSPMCYFGFHNGTSIFDRNWAQSTYLDQMEAKYYNRLVDIWNQVKNSASAKTVRLRDLALDAFTAARDCYAHMDWCGCYDALSLDNRRTTNMMHSAFDSTPPTVYRWGISPDEYNENTTFSVWATVYDNLAGIENVTVLLSVNGSERMYSCSYDGGNWTVLIPPFYHTTEHNVSAKLRVLDKGLNELVTEPIVLYTSPDGSTTPITNPTLEPLVTGIIVASSIIIIVGYVVIRRRH